MIEQLVYDPAALRGDVRQLLNEIGWDDRFTLNALPGGANNRVFLVETSEGSGLLKVYFRHRNDPRDRLQSEFRFAQFAWQHGVRRLPQPLACSCTAGLGLYEFISGRPLLPGEVLDDMVTQALMFYCEVNRHKQAPETADLPQASEACFSLAEHLDCVERRVHALTTLAVEAPVDREAEAFVRESLLPAWQTVARNVRRRAADLDLEVEEEIAAEDRCLSPSDFGFHNAILADDGRLRFVDFEYAGWDDPAKLICDFFCQPAVPAPATAYERFVRRVGAELSDPDRHFKRAALLLPVYQIKWCCILLNDFLPAGSWRRRFARAGDQTQRKVLQLIKVREMFNRIYTQELY